MVNHTRNGDYRLDRDVTDCSWTNLKVKNQEYVLASRTLGATNTQLIVKHLIPNVMGPIIVMTMFTIPSAVFGEAFLSFIGLGIQPPFASLGSLVNDGYKSIQTYPHMMFIPAVVISMLILAFNLMADGLRDALDPKCVSKRGGRSKMKTLLEVKDLQVSFDTHAGEVQAVRGVTFDLKKGNISDCRRIWFWEISYF